MTSRNITPLPSALVERGEVKKESLFNLDGISISLLFLSPHAKVAEHPHTSDNEIYILLVGLQCICTINGTLQHLKCGDKSICLAGERHSLENTSSVSTIRVLSIKYPAVK